MSTTTAYDVLEVENDRSYRGCKKAERVLVTLKGPSTSPLAATVCMGDGSSNLHTFTTTLPSTTSSEPIALRFQQQSKRVYHDSTQLLDAWGVGVTIVDGKLALVALPLPKDAAATPLDETKGAVFFSAHEQSGTLVCATKQHSLLVYDWIPKNAKLLPRSTHEVPDKPSTLQSVLCLSSDMAVLIYKRKTTLFHLDTGRSLDLPPDCRDPVLGAVRLPGLVPSQDDFFVFWRTHGIALRYDRSEYAVVTTGAPVPWPAGAGPPKAVLGHHPFLLIAYAEHVDVLLSFQIVQSVAIKGALLLAPLLSQAQTVSVTAPPTVLVATGPVAFAALRMRPLSDQLRLHLDAGRYQEAIDLCRLCPVECHLSADELRRIHLQLALQQFERHEFRRAMDNFLASHVPAEEVLALFPDELLPRSRHRLALATLPRPSVALAGETLSAALSALVQFLVAYRTLPRQGLAKVQYDDVASLVDTVLLKAYVLTNDAALTAFCGTSPSAADVGEAEVFLRAHAKWPALLAFYKTQRLHRKGLELLEELQASSKKDPRREMVAYLKTLSEAPLVFEFSKPVLQSAPALGLSIFTHRLVPPTEVDIDPHLIVDHLKSIEVSSNAKQDENGGDDEMPLDDGRALAIAYLHQVIYANGSRVPSTLHDELVYLLLDAINHHVSLLLKKKRDQQSLIVFHTRVRMQKGRLGALRRQLLAFLQSPLSQHHPERLLSRTPMEMIEERAVLLANMGRHEEVLRLYLHEIKDAAVAEAYCNDVYASKVGDASIYTLFLQTYMRPPSAKTSPYRMSNHALSSIGLAFVAKFMLRHAATIDVATALELLPPGTEAAALSAYLQRVLELKVEARRTAQVQTQLLKIENLHVRSQLHAAQQESVDISAQSTCAVCSRKLERGAFLYDKDEGTLLHYACQPSLP
ncbi:hypothetical protein SPRG_06100 [Saprolegnia parasitica CBS 223.65]|uniref:Vacuolar sorting protein 39/Transforming growth factor beta receptor-associated domain-containing protein n=1 Tax=Saprolegnia parasitica (strain CBS 223.65) TaxID=695850 RepID=A0A067CIN3_SAPPC|nr:hypothetical protein SPRG_06100 [Saprolegnia parasitica CBS 223.65]KDO29045.1 hypothetical protein SPRG_06100 [Saprolegnia parasitica CBS 223.65]|eukprot:XP_012200215.1 hypothetical protein SPRG_06100 [Saprolegnia parasitica CBS 223.65]